MKGILRRVVLGVVAVGVLMGMMTAPAWAKQTPLSALSTPTWQTNGTVRALAYANGKLFVGGEFTSVRPPGAAAGTGEVARSYLAVFNATTGELLPNAPQPNGRVWALSPSPDGATMYAGGDFTQIYGAGRGRIAAIDTNALNLRPAFRPFVTYRVSTIDATADSVYFGGSFTEVAGQSRERLAAVRASDGGLLPWNPRADYDVAAVKAAPDASKVYLGGRFANIGGAHRESVALVDAQAGAQLSFPAQNALPNRTGSCWTFVRQIVTAENSVYFANAGDGGGCFDGTWSASIPTGQLNWKNNCLGATESIEVVGNWLFKGSHAHDCSMEGGFPQGGNRTLLAQRTDTGEVQGWYPNTNVGGTTKVGPLDMATDGTRLWVGGDFTTVNGAIQQGFALFGTSTDAPPRRPLTPGVSSTRTGSVDVRITASLDNDDEFLNYKVFRNNSPVPIDVRSVRSRFWDIPSYTITDSGLAPGSQVAYRVEVSDGTNTVQSFWTEYVNVAATNADYPTTVAGDGAQYYWRTAESSGTTVADQSGNNTGRTSNGASTGATGPYQGSRAVDLGSSSSYVYSTTEVPGPQNFSVETWVKTTSSNGGRIIGFGNNRTGTSSNYDRHLYMDNSGRLNFGVWPGNAVLVTGSNAVNDGRWHHVVVTMGGGKLELFVDGVSQANTPVSGAQGYSGYWRLGADNLNGWPSQPRNAGLVGQVSNVAIYPFTLDASKVAWHNLLARGNTPPVADFSASCNGLNCSFDASASSASNGSIASYEWNFGDGATASGKVTTHQFTSAGTRTVRLTVTDSSGVSSTKNVAVTATAPNQAPVAAAAAECTFLSCTFDASGSTDPDGSIASYAWNFGDGTSGTGVKPQHSYTAAGSYTATVTVTDNSGASNSASTTVTVSAQPSNVPPVAAATFSCAALACSFDGSTSSDPDGVLSSYAWQFGDGAQATGVTTQHTYAAPGVYQAVLTVTDNRGAQASTTVAVDISSGVPAGTVLAKDEFARTLNNSWGSANPGGAWSAAGTASRYGVSPGTARMTMTAPGNQPSVALNSFSARDVDLSLELSLDKAATGGGVYFSVDQRNITGSGAYRAKVRYVSNNRVFLSLIAVGPSGSETVLVPETQVLAAAPAPGNEVKLRFLVTGSGTTSLKAKLWDGAAAEPAAWQLSTTDSTAALQQAGSIALRSVLSGSATNAPVQLGVGDFLVTTPR